MLIPDEAVAERPGAEVRLRGRRREPRALPAVTVGPLHDGLRVVREGLTPDDRVIVSGVQRVRPDVAVDAEERTPEDRRAQPTAATARSRREPAAG